MSEVKFIRCPECGRHYVSMLNDPDFDIMWHLTREHGWAKETAKKILREDTYVSSKES